METTHCQYEFCLESILQYYRRFTPKEKPQKDNIFVSNLRKENGWQFVVRFKMELGWAKKSKKNYVPVVSQMVYLSLLPATMAELVDFSKAVGLYACKVKDL